MSTQTSTGSYVRADANNRLRAEFVATLTYPGGSLTADDTTATLAWSLRLRKHPSDPPGSYIKDTSAYSVTGGASASGSKAWPQLGPNGVTTIASGSRSVSLTYSAQTLNFTGSIDHVSFPGVPTVSAAVAIPRRPYTAPAPPTNVTATRLSDSQAKVEWENNGTTGAPVTDNIIMRSSLANPTHIAIITVAGSAESYIDPTITDDERYHYRVRAKNSAGSGYSSSSAPAAYVSTTPGKPGAPTAARSGMDILVNRGSLPASATHWRVWDSEDDGTPALVSGAIAASVDQWPHEDPDPATTHTYFIEAVTSQPTLYSALSNASNTVQLQAPPLAPTINGPVAADATKDITLALTHNSRDTSPLRKLEVETRGSSADPWVSEGEVTTSVGEYLFDADTWTNGTTRRIRARTWGDHADPSEWSAEYLLPLSGSPVVAITSPTSEPWTSQVVTATWTFYDPEGSAQQSWEALLLVDSQVVSSQSGQGDPSVRSVEFPIPVDNESTAEVRVRATDGVGLASDWDSVIFPVEYAPPPTPVVVAQWHSDDGHTTLSVSVPAPVGDEETVTTVHMERATSAGWKQVGPVLDPEDLPTTVVDHLPPLGRAVTYRAVAVSTTGSRAYSEPESVDTATPWLFFNYGPGFGQVVRLDSNVAGRRSVGREKAYLSPAGRTLPVVRSGEHVTEPFSITASLWAPWMEGNTMLSVGQSSWDDIRALAYADDPSCFRDPYGLVLICSVGMPEEGDLYEDESRVTIPITAIDWAGQEAIT